MADDEDSNLISLEEAKRRQRQRPGAGLAQAVVTAREIVRSPAPPRRWLVDGWLPAGYVTGLYGDGGTGKSLLAQMLGTACATGQPWLGLPTTPCTVLALFCEDDDEELHRRQVNICDYYGEDFMAAHDFHWVARRGFDNELVTFDGTQGGIARPTELYAELLDQARDLKADLVIVDTAADTFGGNENDRRQVRQYIQAVLGALARAIGGSVLLTAHPSRAGMTTGDGDGGSTGWSNTLRSRLFLARPKPEDGDEEDFDARILKRPKANYAAAGDELLLRWRDGVFHLDGQATGIVAAIQRQSHARAVLDAIHKLCRQGRQPSPAPNAGNYVVKAVLGLPEIRAQRLRRGDVARAVEELFGEGKIRAADRLNGSRHPVRVVEIVGEPPAQGNFL